MNKIKNPHSLIVGEKYKITHPIYDDYNEGLSPDIEIVEVFKKTRDGFILNNIACDLKYEIKYNMLMNCEIEKL